VELSRFKPIPFASRPTEVKVGDLDSQQGSEKQQLGNLDVLRLESKCQTAREKTDLHYGVEDDS